MIGIGCGETTRESTSAVWLLRRKSDTRSGRRRMEIHGQHRLQILQRSLLQEEFHASTLEHRAEFVSCKRALCYNRPMPSMPDLSSLLGTFLPLVKEYMGASFGACNMCSEPATPIPCSKCGERTCLTHAYISGEIVTRRALPKILCSRCYDAIEVEGGRQYREAPKVVDVKKERFAWACSVFGVKQNASKAAIKKRYKELCVKYHPDKNPGDGAAAAAFKQVQQAMEALKDAGKA